MYYRKKDMLCNGINQIFFMCYKNPNYWHLYNIIISYIIYSYKYLESDLIKHCHVICTHSLGQPRIVRSHSKVHRSGGNPKEIPTWASRVSNYSYFPWFNRQQTGSSLKTKKTFYILYRIFFAKPQVFYYLVSDAKYIPRVI